jgi:hypothetical protein
MSIEKLSLEEKSKGKILTAEEFNEIPRKINEIIDCHTLGGLNNVSPDADIRPQAARFLCLKEGTDQWVPITGEELNALTATSISYYLRIENRLQSNNMAVSKNDTACNIKFRFTSKVREVGQLEYVDTLETCTYEVYVKSGDDDYVLKKTVRGIKSNTDITVNVMEYLADGTNKVMVVATGEDTGEKTPNYIYTVTLTSLYLDISAFSWWTAKTGDIELPCRIGGNVSKILHVEINGNNYSAIYQKNYGTATHTTSPSIYTIPFPGITGIYTVKAWLTNADETISTEPCLVQFACLANGEAAKLLVINDISSKIFNWAENNVFSYSVIDGIAAKTSLSFTVKKGENNVAYNELSALETGTRHIYALPLEIDETEPVFQLAIHANDGESSLMEPIVCTVDNTQGYAAAPGAVFYLNAKMRNNSDKDKLKILNHVDGNAAVDASWQGMNWLSDGWVKDNDGLGVLRVAAGSNVSINYKPFERECIQTGKTIELDYRMYNVSDYSPSAIRINMPYVVNGLQEHIGLIIRPNDIYMATMSLHNSELQSIPVDDSVRIRVAIVVQPKAYQYTVGGVSKYMNLIAIYINGRKNRVYQYELNDSLLISGTEYGNIEIGTPSADIDVYAIRVYDTGLGPNAVHQNYVNSLPGTAEKAAEKAKNQLYDAMGNNLDFLLIKSMMNVFVIDKPFPSLYTNDDLRGQYGLGGPDKVSCKVSWYNNANPELNCDFTTSADGQGTSSKKYFEWNVRFKNGDKTVVTYSDGTSKITKKVQLFNNILPCSKITAKKNWASSMQDHKAGSVNSFTDIWRELGMYNDASLTNDKVRVSVYQEAAMGFYKRTNEDGSTTYVCMGEFTIGPDKGDAACFGYDTDKYPSLISIEGSDNAPLLALFRVPWNRSRVVYNEDEEAYQYIVNAGTTENAWDLDAGGDGTASEAYRLIEQWIPAYNLVYSCSPFIKPWNGTLEELSARMAEVIAEYAATGNADVFNEFTGSEYWIAAEDEHQYDLYFYDTFTNSFSPSTIDDGVTTVNLAGQLVDKGYGLSSVNLAAMSSNDEINEAFKAARRMKFTLEAEEYWDIDDALYHRNIVEHDAATDNLAKNTYPYFFGYHDVENRQLVGKWKWRGDDFDTKFPITNQGQLRKPYYVEFHDRYSTGGFVWNGEGSVLWNLLEQCYYDGLDSRGFRAYRAMLDAMCGLSGSAAPLYAGKLYDFYKKYYLSIKTAFPAAVINEDMTRYERAQIWMQTPSDDGAGTVYQNDTSPLSQALGDLYSAETAWMKKRIQYMMSKYAYGDYSAKGLGSITVRTQNNLTFNLTPAIAMYPCVMNGTSMVRGARTMPGETCAINIVMGATGDQQVSIKGANYLTSIGDWHGIPADGALSVVGAMLRELVLGNNDASTIKLAITALTVNGCASLERIVLTNLATLNSTVDLSDCAHLKEVSAKGTQIPQLKLPEGGVLQRVIYPASNLYLLLKNFPLLSNSGIDISACTGSIMDLLVQDCPNIQSISLLTAIMNAQASQASHALKHIRLVGFDETANSSMLDILAKLADGSYSGLSSEGLAGNDEYPVLDGRIEVQGYCYEETFDSLKASFPKLDLNVTGFYIPFADMTTRDIVARKLGDGTGITPWKAANTTDIGTIFAYTGIVSFMELRYFSVTVIRYNGAFRSCTSLKEIDTRHIQEISEDCFRGCSQLQYVNLSSLKKVGPSAFNGTKIKNLTLPSITYIGNYAWGNCSLAWVKITAPAVPTLANANAFNQAIIYVPDDLIDNYMSATNWSSLSSRIRAMSTFVE